MNEKPKTHRPVFKLRELARLFDCPYEGDGETEIRGVAALGQAGPGDLVFMAGTKHRPELKATRASAAIVPPDEPFDRLPVLRAANPQQVFIRAVELFFSPYRPAPGIHPTAVVSASAHIGRKVSIGALSVIGDEAEVGTGTVIFPLVSVYPRVKIGAECVIHSHVSLREDVRVGDRVILHNGVVIGGDGFGFLPNPDGTHSKIPQKGIVVIEDDVEVGANSTIDRAALGETVIRRGTKIDNLVTVAHNVEVGANSILAAQTGIAGSSTVGSSVVMGGQVGVADHVQIGDRVSIAAKSGVARDIPEGLTVAGIPHLDIRQWLKWCAATPQLYDMVRDYKKLKARVEELEKALAAKTPKSSPQG